MDSLLKPSLFLLIGACCAVYRANAQDKYMLDNSTNNHCGKTFKLEPDKEIILASSGRAPKDMGFCSAMVYAIGKDDKNCHGLCMTVLSQFINVCHAKIQFKGMAFGKDVDPYKADIELQLETPHGLTRVERDDRRQHQTTIMKYIPKNK